MTTTEVETVRSGGTDGTGTNAADAQLGVRPHRWFTVALVSLLGFMLAVRFLALEVDAPYGIVSTSGAFLTDEGYYTKSALLFVRFGTWSNDVDIVWRSHNWLFTFIQAGWMMVLGISVAAIRSVSAAAFAASILAFYGICRTVQPRVAALISCLLVAVTLQTFAYSRMALIEPVGTAFCLGALWFWVRGRGRVWGMAGSMLLIAAAYATKVSFIYAVVALVLLNLGDAVVAWRKGERGRALLPVGAIAMGLLLIRVTGDMAMTWSAEDGKIFQEWHVDSRAKGIEVWPVIEHELKMLFRLCWESGASALTCSLAFGVLFVAIKGRLRSTLSNGASRATIAMVLWCAGGASFFGLFGYQPPRYFYFAIFPIAFSTVALARQVVGDRHWRLALLYLGFLHGAVQVPGYKEWVSRDELYSYRETARQLVSRMEFEDHGPTVLMGGTSAFISLFEPRIRPVGLMHRWDFRNRLERWWPRYVIARDPEVPLIQPACPELIREIREVGRYPLLGNYYFGDDHVLVEIVYHDGVKRKRKR